LSIISFVTTLVWTTDWF